MSVTLQESQVKCNTARRAWWAAETIRAASLVGLVAGTPTAIAACPATPATLDADAERVVSAYEQLDTASIPVLADQVRTDASCVQAPVDPGTAARAHFALAIDAWMRRDRPAAVAALRGALSADPGFALDTALVPVGNELHDLLAEARRLGPGASQALAAGVRLRVDGHDGQDSLPTERSALAQTADGRSWYVDAGRLPGSFDLLPPHEPPAAVRRTSRNLLLAGAAVGLTSGLSLLMAADARADFTALGEPSAERLDEAHALWRRNRVAAYGGYGLAVVAGGMAVGAAFTAPW